MIKKNEPLNITVNRNNSQQRLHFRNPDLAENRYLGIGSEFASAREESGIDIIQVSQRLKIRSKYLIAIELGDFQSLPALTYAIGFVRTYSEFLGLDSESSIKRFKIEMGDNIERKPLLFPEGEPIERIPRGWLVGIASILAAVIFSTWYYFESSDQLNVNIVPEAPPAQLTEINQAPLETEILNEIEENIINNDELINDVATKLENNSLNTLNNEEPEIVSQPLTNNDDQNLNSLSTLNETTDKLQPIVIERSEPRAIPSQPPAPIQIVAAEPDTEEVLSDVVEEEVIPSIPPAIPDEVAALNTESEPEVLGENSNETRIIILALEDSWVQITGVGGEIIFSRILRSGDIYHLPNREDLLLMTGNAGALEITVDGDVVSSIGPIGAVRRNISLSPDRLLAGTALDR